MLAVDTEISQGRKAVKELLKRFGRPLFKEPFFLLFLIICGLNELISGLWSQLLYY